VCTVRSGYSNGLYGSGLAFDSLERRERQHDADISEYDEDQFGSPDYTVAD
jgi:hypothetical protein